MVWQMCELGAIRVAYQEDCWSHRAQAWLEEDEVTRVGMPELQ